MSKLYLERCVRFCVVLVLGVYGCATAQAPQTNKALTPVWLPLQGERISRSSFANPYGNIPAQCYSETSFGTQNACQFCHTNGVARLKLGNNNAQAGDDAVVGNLQATYAFTPLAGTEAANQQRNASHNPWQNTIAPQELSQLVSKLGYQPQNWNMQAYIRQDNWQAAYDQRPKTGNDWDTAQRSAFRLFPALSPADLPAQSDGFVRTNDPQRSMWSDSTGHFTGWRAINFMPYGIFSPLTGSVSGIYIRLATPFMQNAAGIFDTDIYRRNLDLLRNNIQGRLPDTPTHYLGAAQHLAVERGQYPVGTEFAHPLHYVDLSADGNTPVSPFPGTRAKRVKEVRWMYKVSDWDMQAYGKAALPREITDDSEGDESGESETAGVLASRSEGWINNGAGWLLGGWIENATGQLRAQTPAELSQCVGCHSGNTATGGVFTSGTGNTVDSTWAMPRQLTGPLGWQEMNYLGYQAPSGGAAYGTLSTPEPLNRAKNVGEYRYFLDHVVGVSLYGTMPQSIDDFLHAQITRAGGYSANWPTLTQALSAKDSQAVKTVQQLRQTLMREFTARGGYLSGATLRPELFLPTLTDAQETARRYRQVVVSQRYEFGKDVFAQVPFSYLYFRTPQTAFNHLDMKPYQAGELITDRPVDTNPSSPDYGVGVTSTLIKETGNFVPDYTPFLK